MLTSGPAAPFSKQAATRKPGPRCVPPAGLRGRPLSRRRSPRRAGGSRRLPLPTDDELLAASRDAARGSAGAGGRAVGPGPPQPPPPGRSRAGARRAGAEQGGAARPLGPAPPAAPGSPAPPAGAAPPLLAAGGGAGRAGRREAGPSARRGDGAAQRRWLPAAGALPACERRAVRAAAAAVPRRSPVA